MWPDSTNFIMAIPYGTGQFISAGHNPAYVYRAVTGKIEDLVSDACVLGMFDFASYQASPLHLHKGDILTAFTQGIQQGDDITFVIVEKD
ncbi:MAG TPA: SpoIIE family protein phosphatase [Bryobacteraceae bacterium]|nr:SpoIIE family protein phosphatase [Bryobacteraceae bacterium]